MAGWWVRFLVALAIAGAPWPADHAAAQEGATGTDDEEEATPSTDLLPPRIDEDVELKYGMLPGAGYARLVVAVAPRRFRDRPKATLLGTTNRANVLPFPNETQKTILSFPVPALEVWRPWRNSHLTVTGTMASADNDNPVVTLYDSDVRVSGLWFPLGVTLLVVAFVYPGCALLAWKVRGRALNARAAASGAEVERYPTFLETLDPVQLTRGATGRASLSKLQVFGFSLLVFAVVLYLQLRLGFLTGLSNDVLLLLGISAGGAAAGKTTAVLRERLQYVNWAWLRRRGWLKGDSDIQRRARWRELVTDGDEFDVYRMQMAIFSVVVAVALVMGGYDQIATFEIPVQLLVLLGLSQTVYVGGKAISPSPRAELDQQLSEVRRLERIFNDEASKALGKPPEGQSWTDAQMQAAAQDKYLSYRDALRIAAEMFSTTFKQPVSDPLL